MAGRKNRNNKGGAADELTDMILKQVQESGGTKELYKNGDPVSGLVQKLYQALLEAEMSEHLEQESKEESAEPNSRNGKGKKRIRGDFGEVEITTPRDRQSTFSPQIIPKREKSVGNFTDKIISLYARGMTTREIEEHLGEMYGIEVSPQFITRATEAVQAEIVEWQSRPLEGAYPVVYVDGLRVSIRSGNNAGAVVKKCIYVVLGVSCTGKQEVLGLWVEETEGAKFWLKVFGDLEARGLKDIVILCGDGLKGLPEAVEAVYPKTDVQLCVVHQIRNATKFVSYKDRKKICAAMRPIYTSPTLNAAELALLEFKEQWGEQYPLSVASWERNWQRLSTFYKYPAGLRKTIYTTNTIESLNAQLRKNTSNRKVFPNDAAAIKILYLNIRNFTKKWTKRQGWDSLMNKLAIMFPGRLEAAQDLIAMQ
ncbi:IS256 family transposase [Leptolyngbya iicbica]|uniref:Mutator family transposase n=2 Tax=Cyanophyceae TaxID=3028117 RepID=A0A4Q7E5U4_9CYAN|nr:IS256 family transposase [Leptolyngbya sp. LK]RZM77817.1 IS256 family transposase [Leptolyngbya sp. LK]